jgi:16S rRNA (guanine527-N7)-methyltransferase
VSDIPENPLWNELAARANLSLSAQQHARLHQYLELLFAANKWMNLTRIASPAAAEVLHVADALTLLPLLPAGPHRIADVGSGGGVPGIVLAIVRPDATVVLIESTQKKALFLRETVQQLGLENVSVEPIRAEEAGRSPLRESFDIVVARAVATMPWLVEWLLPLVKKGGFALAMKGAKAADELALAQRTVTKLGGGMAELVPANLIGQENHVIVRIKKFHSTEGKFPRPASIAKGKALGE